MFRKKYAKIYDSYVMYDDFLREKGYDTSQKEQFPAQDLQLIAAPMDEFEPTPEVTPEEPHTHGGVAQRQGAPLVGEGSSGGICGDCPDPSWWLPARVKYS